MSVINKMLKDLEQRQEPENEFASQSATYQAPTASNHKKLIIALSATIVILITVVTWLLLSSENVTDKVQQSPVLVGAVKEPVNNKVSEPQQNDIQQALNQSPVQEQTLTPNSNNSSGGIEQQKESIDETKRPILALKKAQPKAKAETSNISSKKETRIQKNVKQNPVSTQQQTPTPVEQVMTPKPIFSIQKSSAELTPEQRIEKLMKKAQESFDKGYITEAISQLEEVLNSSDGHIEARNLLAVAWYGRGELQAAVQILNDGLIRYPNVERWRLTAAKVYFKENDLNGAFSYLEADLSLASAEYFTMKGTLARQLQKFDKAQSAYTRLTLLQPDNGSWWLGLAIAEDSQGLHEKALISYQKVIEKGGVSEGSLQFVNQRISELQG